MGTVWRSRTSPSHTPGHLDPEAGSPREPEKLELSLEANRKLPGCGGCAHPAPRPRASAGHGPSAAAWESGRLRAHLGGQAEQTRQQPHTLTGQIPQIKFRQVTEGEKNLQGKICNLEMLQYITLNMSGFQKKKKIPRHAKKQESVNRTWGGKGVDTSGCRVGQMLNLDSADRDFKAAIIINMFQELKNVIF